MKWNKLMKESTVGNPKVNAELEFADEVALDLTNFRHIDWEWEDEHHVVVFNHSDCEGDLEYAVGDALAIAEHCLEPLGWHRYEITPDDELDNIRWGGPDVKYKVGLTDM